MSAADEREAPRRAGMVRAYSLWRLRVRYRTADVRRRLVLAQPFIDDLAQKIVLRRRTLREAKPAEAIAQGIKPLHLTWHVGLEVE